MLQAIQSEGTNGITSKCLDFR